MEKHYFLFDIDGVLLNPGGYRRAAHDTIYYFLSYYGFPEPIIDEYAFPVFESLEITSEWDMIPLYILASLELYFDYQNLNYSLDSINDVVQYIKKGGGKTISPSKKIAVFMDFIEDGKSKAECVFEQKNSEKFHACFPKIKNWVYWLIDDLLLKPNDPYISKITAYFQNLILGDQLFSDLLSIPPNKKTESYLVLFDEKRLSDFSREKLVQGLIDKKIYSCAITARPTGISLKNFNGQIYFPEGELGLKTVNMEIIPVIGFGTLTYLATVYGKTGEYYLKPSPIHALAAILASTGYSDIESVRLGYQLITEPLTDKNRRKLDALFSEHVRIHIFEDATGGIRAVKNLTAWLNQIGYRSVNYELYGISEDPIKIQSLKKENAAIYSDINAALKKGLGDIIR